MRRYIDADSLLTKIKAYRPYQYLGEDALSYAIKMVELEPSADVVEVVRCKDCKHIKEEHFNIMPDGFSCELSGLMVEPEHYCSYGER